MEAPAAVALDHDGAMSGAPATRGPMVTTADGIHGILAAGRNAQYR